MASWRGERSSMQVFTVILTIIHLQSFTWPFQFSLQNSDPIIHKKRVFHTRSARWANAVFILFLTNMLNGSEPRTAPESTVYPSRLSLVDPVIKYHHWTTNSVTIWMYYCPAHISLFSPQGYLEKLLPQVKVVVSPGHYLQLYFNIIFPTN